LIFPVSLRRLRPIFEPTLNLPSPLPVDLAVQRALHRHAPLERLNRIRAAALPIEGTVKLTEAERPSVSRFAEREATDWAGLGKILGRGDDTDSVSLAWRLNLTIPQGLSRAGDLIKRIDDPADTALPDLARQALQCLTSHIKRHCDFGCAANHLMNCAVCGSVR
jgi:hypothetical protein